MSDETYTAILGALCMSDAAFSERLNLDTPSADDFVKTRREELKEAIRLLSEERRRSR